MSVLESFYASIIFLILYDFAFINRCASQENYDYEANVKVEKISSSRNKFFKIDGKPPNAHFSVIREIEETNRIYLTEYSTDSSGHTERLASIPLCDQMGQNDTSYLLRDQIFFKFLFLRQRTCPVKQDKFKVPDSMDIKFDYGYIVSSNINCKPWKYRQELRSLSLSQPFMTISVNIDMKKKYKCDPNAESIWAKKLAEAPANSTKGNT